MTRKEARELCFKLIFEYEVQKNDAESMLSYLEEDEQDLGNQREYVESLLHKALDNIKDIDNAIIKNTKGWQITRLPKVTLAILRVAICEMLYMDDIPESISINEAVELAKIYNDEQNGKFVNGILSSVYKEK
ncbi:MAG: transcription antitermination factor NusB [Clostridia bacterium]|nr:transcription antitermination factor NusB [Clostridia bacterium]